MITVGNRGKTTVDLVALIFRDTQSQVFRLSPCLLIGRIMESLGDIQPMKNQDSLNGTVCFIC